ncbi:hypothetical protein HAX54_007046 [Datura stramonium]|uniref:Uncharacterized protein n=1 Tax=Datura stramonium TaxID=4076 RepID=A0ABS8TDJ5_DATST|nr:hypothetical protein [Datura stramonium]
MSASTENGSMWREIPKSTGRIMKAQSRHFYALSILFLLPIFFTLLVYPSFHLALFHPDYEFSIFSDQLQFPHFSLSNFEIIVPTVCTLFLALFSLCPVAIITHSAVQSFYDRPINLVSSLKSIRTSFFPLFSTLIVSQIILITIALVFALVLVFSVQILQSLGLIELKYVSNHFSFFVIFGSMVLLPVLIWLQVNWSLAYVIAVIESKWGFETLRRSAYLVKGKRWVALSMMLIHGLLMGFIVVWGSIYLVLMDPVKGNRWRSLTVILQTLQNSVLGFMMMNQYLVGNVALYMYCNDFNGENLPMEIGVKSAGAGEYVSLPLDDEEKNHAIV